LGSVKADDGLHIDYNNDAGLTSKVSEEIAGENAENGRCRQRCRQPHCRLTPHPQGTSANIRIKLISPETRVIGSFLPLIVCVPVYLHSIFLWWAPKDTYRPFMVIKDR